MIPTRDEIERWIMTMRTEIDRLQADLDRANTEAAMARDALAKATTPAPDREAAIRAWEEDATLHRCGSRFDDDDPRATYLMARSEITAAVALMRSADGKALLRELREDLEVYPDGIWTTREMVAKIGLLLVQPAPVEQPAAAVPDHFPDAGKMVPVLYWLEDGKFARAMLVGKDLLVVDLTFGDGPSVVGKPEWFDAGYVAAYGGLVPESATRGKEPGQWDYGVASIAKPSAVPDDTRELVAQLADLFKVHLSCNGGVNRQRSDRAAEIAARLRGSK